MHNLAKEFDYCLEQVHALGIKTNPIASITINTRATGRWGQCRKSGNSYSINISNRLLQDNVPINSLRQTIIHEILHATDNGMQHKNEWKARAETVNRAYGYNVKRTNSATELGVEPINKAVNANYCCACEKCGYKIYRQRTSDFVKHPENYRHTGCNGKFKRITMY